MDEISENIFNEEFDKLFLVKIQFRENHIRMSTGWKSRIQSEEIRNALYSNHSVSLNLKDDNCWKPINMQIKLNVREYICVASWRWRTIFIKEAMPEVAEKLKKWKRRCYQEEITEKNKKIGIISYAAWSWITNSESILLRSWLTEQLWRTHVPHQALITSSSRKPSREVGMLRNTREEKSIPGDVFDRHYAQQDSDELHNDSRNLAISLAFLRTVGIENSGSEEPLQSMFLPCFSLRARRKSLDDRNKSYVYD